MWKIRQFILFLLVLLVLASGRIMWFWLWCHRSLVSFAAAFEDELKLESCPPRNASISCNIYLYRYIYIHIVTTYIY